MPSRLIHQVIADRTFVCVPIDMPVRAVTQLMQDFRQSAALVTEHGVLTGIFTERDATFRVLAAGLDPDATPVGTVLTHNPQTITNDRPFAHALHMMYEGSFRHVPVISADGRPLGLIASSDALDLDALQFGEELVRREEITVIL